MCELYFRGKEVRMDTRERVIALIREINEDFDPEENVDLIEEEILDSFDMISFIIEVKEEFGVTIGVDDIVPENFATVDQIADLIEQLDE